MVLPADPSALAPDQLLETLITRPALRRSSDLNVDELCMKALSSYGAPKSDINTASEFGKLIENCFVHQPKVRSLQSTPASAASLHQLNAIFLRCCENATAAHQFNQALLSSGPYNYDANPRLYWKILEIRQISFWVDVTTTRTEKELLVAELINYFLRNKSQVRSPGHAVMLVWVLLAQMPPNPAMTLASLSRKIPRSLGYLLTFFAYGEAPGSQWVCATSKDFSRGCLWSPDVYERIAAANNGYTTGPCILDMPASNEKHVPLYLWLLHNANVAAACAPPPDEPPILGHLKRLVASVRERIDSQKFVPQIVKERQEECLMLASSPSGSQALGSVYFTRDSPSYEFLLRMLNNYEHVKAVNALESLCETLMSLGPWNTELLPLVHPLLNFVDSAMADTRPVDYYVTLGRVLTNMMANIKPDGFPIVAAERTIRELLKKIHNPSVTLETAVFDETVQDDPRLMTQYALIRNLFYLGLTNSLATEVYAEKLDITNERSAAFIPFLSEIGGERLSGVALQMFYALINAKYLFSGNHGDKGTALVCIGKSLLSKTGPDFIEQHRAGLELLKSAIEDDLLAERHWQPLLLRITRLLHLATNRADADANFLREAAAVCLWLVDRLSSETNGVYDESIREKWASMLESPAVTAAEFITRGLFQSVNAALAEQPSRGAG